MWLYRDVEQGGEVNAEEVVEAEHGGDDDLEEEVVEAECLQGSRHGRDAHDILWIGKRDAEGTFIWRDQNIQDVYVRYLDEGMLTVRVRVTVDFPINVLVTYVAEYRAHKLELEHALQALAAVPSQLHVNHLGARCSPATLTEACSSSVEGH